METRKIRFQIHFNAPPEKVYHMLMDAEKHALITEGEVKLSGKTDGKFELFGGYCRGYNIELEVGKKIVQAWHFDEDLWPANHFSICSFSFRPDADGCLMEFEQSEVPASSVEALTKGWNEYYWDRMHRLIDERRL